MSNNAPWAKFRSTKGAVKLHVGLDSDGYLALAVIKSLNLPAFRFPRNAQSGYAELVAVSL